MDLIQEGRERRREREGLKRRGKGGRWEEGSGKGQGHALCCSQCVCMHVRMLLYIIGTVHHCDQWLQLTSTETKYSWKDSLHNTDLWLGLYSLCDFGLSQLKADNRESNMTSLVINPKHWSHMTLWHAVGWSPQPKTACHKILFYSVKTKFSQWLVIKQHVMKCNGNWLSESTLSCYDSLDINCTIEHSSKLIWHRSLLLHSVCM